MEKMMINTKNWKPFKISDIFDVVNGKGLTIEEIEDNPGDIPVIQGGETNNGIIGYIDEDYCKTKKYKIIREPFLSLARVGSAGVINFQYKTSAIGDKAKALILRHRKSKNIYLFMSAVLNLEVYKYSYGRGIVTDKYMATIIRLPVTDNKKPDWDYMDKYISTVKSPIKNSLKTANHPIDIKFDCSKWGEFMLSSIFDIKKAHAYNHETFPENNSSTNRINCITRTALNNGCDYKGEFSDDLSFEQGNALTIGGEGIICFYQKNKFVCGTNVAVLRNKHMNCYNGLFLATVINYYSDGRFSYGRAFNKNQITKSVIKLPITSDKKPDWDYMERYIKKLPYADKI